MTETIPAEVILAALTTGEGVTAEFVGPIYRFSGIHPAPGEHVDLQVTLRIKNSEKETN